MSFHTPFLYTFFLKECSLLHLTPNFTLKTPIQLFKPCSEMPFLCSRSLSPCPVLSPLTPHLPDRNDHSRGCTNVCNYAYSFTCLTLLLDCRSLGVPPFCVPSTRLGITVGTLSMLQIQRERIKKENSKLS